MARKIVYDGREFPDPDPAMSIDEVKGYMSSFFPELATAEATTRTEGEDTVIELRKKVGVKGEK